jgi:hypothetical protein
VSYSSSGFFRNFAVPGTALSPNFYILDADVLAVTNVNLDIDLTVGLTHQSNLRLLIRVWSSIADLSVYQTTLGHNATKETSPLEAKYLRIANYIASDARVECSSVFHG